MIIKDSISYTSRFKIICAVTPGGNISQFLRQFAGLGICRIPMSIHVVLQTPLEQVCCECRGNTLPPVLLRDEKAHFNTCTTNQRGIRRADDLAIFLRIVPDSALEKIDRRLKIGDIYKVIFSPRSIQ